MWQKRAEVYRSAKPHDSCETAQTLVTLGTHRKTLRSTVARSASYVAAEESVVAAECGALGGGRGEGCWYFSVFSASL